MAEKDNQFQGVVESLLKGMDTVLSTKTVVGEATKIGDTIILPLVDVLSVSEPVRGIIPRKDPHPEPVVWAVNDSQCRTGDQKRFHQAGQYQKSGYCYQDSGYDSRYCR